MKRIIKLTERDLTRIVKRIINEDTGTVPSKNTQSSSSGGTVPSKNTQSSSSGNINRQVFYPHTDKAINKTLRACKAGDTGTIVSWTKDQMLALSDVNKGGPFCSLKH